MSFIGSMQLFMCGVAKEEENFTAATKVIVFSKHF
jgi:hypothetical protein